MKKIVLLFVLVVSFAATSIHAQTSNRTQCALANECEITLSDGSMLGIGSVVFCTVPFNRVDALIADLGLSAPAFSFVDSVAGGSSRYNEYRMLTLRSRSNSEVPAEVILEGIRRNGYEAVSLKEFLYILNLMTTPAHPDQIGFNQNFYTLCDLQGVITDIPTAHNAREYTFGCTLAPTGKVTQLLLPFGKNFFQNDIFIVKKAATI